MMIMNNLEWPMLSYYVIYYETFRKVMHRTEKVALSGVRPYELSVVTGCRLHHRDGSQHTRYYLCDIEVDIKQTISCSHAQTCNKGVLPSNS